MSTATPELQNCAMPIPCGAMIRVMWEVVYGLFQRCPAISPEYQSQAWMQAIINVRPQLLHILNKIADSGYADYWSKDVYPRLNDKIRSYYSHIPPGLLDRIHEELAAFALPEIFNDAHTNIFVLDIDNAFNLMDETFCCTYLLLDPELEKVYHLDFMKVYVHENLHRLRISEDR